MFILFIYSWTSEGWRHTECPAGGSTGLNRAQEGIRRDQCLQGKESYLMDLAGFVRGMEIGSDSKRGMREAEDSTGRPAPPTFCSPLSTGATFPVFLNEIWNTLFPPVLHLQQKTKQTWNLFFVAVLVTLMCHWNKTVCSNCTVGGSPVVPAQV